MAIRRRTPEMTSELARRLKQIDADGQPIGDEALAEGKMLVAYGWVQPHEWSLTDVGAAAMNGYYNGIAAERAARKARDFTPATIRD